MVDYLIECMGIAVQTAVGGFCWLVVVMALVICIGIASYLLNRETKVDFSSKEDIRIITGGKDD